jgi:hypothetical protein
VLRHRWRTALRLLPRAKSSVQTASAFTTAPSGDMKRCPFEEASFIKQQTDDHGN